MDALPVLVLTVGHCVFRTLVETAEREGLDVNSLGVGLLMLGLGKQTAFVQAPPAGFSLTTRRPDNPHWAYLSDELERDLVAAVQHCRRLSSANMALCR
jgi:hypothetical protein